MQLLVKSVHAGGVCLDERWLDLAFEPRRKSGRRRLEEALTAHELEIVRLATTGARNRDTPRAAPSPVKIISIKSTPSSRSTGAWS